MPKSTVWINGVPSPEQAKGVLGHRFSDATGRPWVIVPEQAKELAVRRFLAGQCVAIMLVPLHKGAEIRVPIVEVNPGVQIPEEI